MSDSCFFWLVRDACAFRHVMPTSLPDGAASDDQAVNTHRHTDNAEMFYFYFENRNLSAAAPVVLWLTGGPGVTA